MALWPRPPPLPLSARAENERDTQPTFRCRQSIAFCSFDKGEKRGIQNNIVITDLASLENGRSGRKCQSVSGPHFLKHVSSGLTDTITHALSFKRLTAIHRINGATPTCVMAVSCILNQPRISTPEPLAESCVGIGRHITKSMRIRLWGLQG